MDFKLMVNEMIKARKAHQMVLNEIKFSLVQKLKNKNLPAEEGEALTIQLNFISNNE